MEKAKTISFKLTAHFYFRSNQTFLLNDCQRQVPMLTTYIAMLQFCFCDSDGVVRLFVFLGLAGVKQVCATTCSAVPVMHA